MDAFLDTFCSCFLAYSLSNLFCKPTSDKVVRKLRDYGSVVVSGADFPKPNPTMKCAPRVAIKLECSTEIAA